MKHDHETHRPNGKVVTALVIGNALEWFDFIIYALLANTISKLFFPSEDPLNSLLLGFATLGVAFVARPIGGIVFGLYADRYGRNRTLSVIFIVMAVSTAMVALLPVYAAIGIAAPLLLLVCRMLQGFSAGGEFGNATTLLIEIAPAKAKGFFGSLQMCSQAIAILVAAILVLCISKSLSAEDFESWGWRVPFIVGAVIAPIGLFLRNGLSESPEFHRAAKQGPSSTADPLLEIGKYHKTELVAAIGLFAAVTGPNYVNTVFMPSMAVAKQNIQQSEAMTTILIVSILMVVLIPAFGWLSDKTSRVTVAVGGMVGTAIVYPILLFNYLSNSTLSSFMILEIGYCAPYAAIVGSASTWAIERLPVMVRSTGSSIGYNLATMLFGGLCPFWLTLLERQTNSEYGPAIFVFFTMSAGLCGAFLLYFRSRKYLPLASEFPEVGSL